MKQHKDRCQCCNTSPLWLRLTDDFSRCSHCGVYRNNKNLLEDRPIPRDIASKIDVAEVKHCVEKYTPILQRLEKIVPVRKIYDVACGCGGCVWLSKVRGWESGGCDINLSHQRNAASVFGVGIDIGLENFPDKIGCVFFHHGIEHVDSPLIAFHNALDSLVPGGIIYLQHPVMPDKEDEMKEVICTGHQYEWTHGAFINFLDRWNGITYEGKSGTYYGGGSPVSQEWIVTKK